MTFFKKKYRIGTRSSPLALKQAEEVVSLLRNFCAGFSADIVKIATYGDIDKRTPISEIEGTDFFTREIDEAVLAREVDFAVHSAKDMPDTLRTGLTVAAITKTIDPYDVLVSKNGLRLDELPKRSRIGTSSKRRKEQLKAYRNDLDIVDIRGTIEERLKTLYNSDIEAIVIAAAGLLRLGLERHIAQRLPFDIVQPHELQGSLAVVVREDNKDLMKLAAAIDSGKRIA